MAVRVIPQGWNLPADIVQRVGTKVGRQRAMVADGHLLLLLHAPPDPGVALRRERLFWLDPAGEWKSTDFGTGQQALRRHLDEYEARVAAIDRSLGRDCPAEELHCLMQQITPLHRSASNLHNALQQARDYTGHDHELIDCRDHAGQIARTLELLRVEARDCLDYRIAADAERQAKAANALATSSQRLNVMAALFFPLVTISGVFGMNLAHGFERQPGLFWMVVGAGLLVGAMLWAGLRCGRPRSQGR